MLLARLCRGLLPAALGGLLVACTRPDTATSPPALPAAATPAPASTDAAPTAAPLTTSTPVLADCTQPFGLLDGTELTYELLDEKNRPEGSQILKVVSITPKQGEKKRPAYTEVLLKSSRYDANQRLEHNDEYVYQCRQDTVLTDGRLLLDPALLRSFRDRRFAFSPTSLPWPNQPSSGPLPGGQLTVQVSSPSVDIAKVTTTVSARRLSGPENVTVPAGTFRCYKVESRYEYVTQARADMARRAVKRVVDYYAPSVGIVRSEMRDADGELDHVAQLSRRREANR